jgi:SAM-dependent methyltransferase
VTGEQVSARWAQWRADVDLGEYHSRWERLEAEGTAAHGEADLICLYRPPSVLDAGCGMGRVAIELARRGIDVEGVDLDDDLLAYARSDAPHITWYHDDLATMALPRRYALVAMPGNVMLFCKSDVRGAIVANLAGHLEPSGLLIAGFSLDAQPGAITLAEYDHAASEAGLELVDRFATWEGAPYDDGRYAVSIHRHVRPR